MRYLVISVLALSLAGCGDDSTDAADAVVAAPMTAFTRNLMSGTTTQTACHQYTTAALATTGLTEWDLANTANTGTLVASCKKDSADVVGHCGTSIYVYEATASTSTDDSASSAPTGVTCASGWRGDCAEYGMKEGITANTCVALVSTDLTVTATSTTYTGCWTYTSSILASAGLKARSAATTPDLTAVAAACPTASVTASSGYDLLGTCSSPAFTVFEMQEASVVASCRPATPITGWACIAANWATDCATGKACLAPSTPDSTTNTCAS